MNKSTPINQLPNTPMKQNAFINDSQRQIVTNAQHAINNMSIPQNTQAMQDPIVDDDMEIQEALNDVNAQLNQGGAQQQQPPPVIETHYEYQRYPVPNIPIENQTDIMYPPTTNHAAPQRYFSQGLPQSPPPHMYGVPTPPSLMMPSKTSPLDINTLLSKFSEDLKLALLVAVTVAVLHFVPFSSFIGKYIAIEKIPYHNVIFRAIFAAAVIVFVKNTLL